MSNEQRRRGSSPREAAPLLRVSPFTSFRTARSPRSIVYSQTEGLGGRLELHRTTGNFRSPLSNHLSRLSSAAHQQSMTSFPRVDERQRSSSLSEATPKATTRPFPFAETRAGSSTSVATVGGAAVPSGAGAGAVGGAAGHPPALPRHNNGPSTREAGSQPTSGRASPVLSLSSRSLRTLPPSQRNTSFRSPTLPTAGSSSSNLPSTFKSLDSYSSRNVSAALEPGPSEVRQIDDVWQAVCVRVLPL